MQAGLKMFELPYTHETQEISMTGTEAPLQKSSASDVMRISVLHDSATKDEDGQQVAGAQDRRMEGCCSDAGIYGLVKQSTIQTASPAVPQIISVAFSPVATPSRAAPFTNDGTFHKPIVSEVKRGILTDEKKVDTSKKRRRSKRNSNRIQLWERTSLARRRFEQLFDELTDSPLAHAIRIGNWMLERVHSSPNIYTIDNFLTSSDLDYFRSCISNMPFERSYVDNPQTMERHFDTTHRTSTFLSFDKRQNSKIAAIEQRAATLMGCFTTGSVEALQLVRYHVGEFFGVHHDLGNYDVDTGTVELPPKQIHVRGCNRRLVTIFCYLNDVEEGGQTQFPSLGLTVQPQAGRAVVWQNILPSGEPDARTIHAGLSVEKGIKYALNIWLCEE